MKLASRQTSSRLVHSEITSEYLCVHVSKSCSGSQEVTSDFLGYSWLAETSSRPKVDLLQMLSKLRDCRAQFVEGVRRNRGNTHRGGD